jgi:pyrroline-5-carboxylate reductase
MSIEILLVGCGKMGGALLAGWIDQGRSPDAITVIESSPEAADAVAARHPVRVLGSVAEYQGGHGPRVVVFAVKPQTMDAVVPSYAHLLSGETVFLSIAAGKPLDYFTSKLGVAAAVVRAMPNTPAAVRRGITVAIANDRVIPSQVRACDDLLSAVGEVMWLEDESTMDAVTAVSGSGPAYVFLLTESLAHAGVEAGLPAEVAARLARATVAGAGELLYRADDPPAVLRENVTSPGGTTAAALAVLMADNGLRPLLDRAVREAAKRSRELAG